MALTFAFDATKETPATVAQRRALVAALMGRRDQGGVRSLGEGIGDGLMLLGDGITARVEKGRADRGEQAGLASAADAFGTLFPSTDFPAAPAQPSSIGP